MHTRPAGHTVPHEPQLASSVCSARHVPEHRLWPVGHTHAPPVHTRPAGHTVPHEPQFDVSVCRLRHVPEHCVCPAGQQVIGPPWQNEEPDRWHWSIPANVRHHTQPAVPVHVPHVPPLQVTGVTHAPAVQVCPAAHALPHPPQFAVSVCRLRHVPEHKLWPDGHAHTPALHTRPAGHTVPHVPQFDVSVCRLRHVPEHKVCPAGQHEIGPPWQNDEPDRWHWSMPANVRHHTQPAVPAHAPHVPPLQLAGVTHAPAVQVCPAAHALPHEPQFAVSVCRLRQVVPQRDCPEGQHEMAPPWQKPEPLAWHWSMPANVRHQMQPGVAAQPPHVVLVHVGATMHLPPVHCCPVGHALPQAPQCVRLVCVSTQVEPQRVCPEGQHERGVLWQKPEPRVWHWSMPANVRHHTQPRTLVHAPHVPPLQDAVWQRPATQVWPEAHTVLQLPQ